MDLGAALECCYVQEPRAEVYAQWQDARSSFDLGAHVTLVPLKVDYNLGKVDAPDDYLRPIAGVSAEATRWLVLARLPRSQVGAGLSLRADLDASVRAARRVLHRLRAHRVPGLGAATRGIPGPSRQREARDVGRVSREARVDDDKRGAAVLPVNAHVGHGQESKGSTEPADLGPMDGQQSKGSREPGDSWPKHGQKCEGSIEPADSCLCCAVLAMASALPELRGTLEILDGQRRELVRSRAHAVAAVRRCLGTDRPRR